MSRVLSRPEAVMVPPVPPVPQVGPVVLAMKPVEGARASLAVARWLAAREDRELHVVTVLQQDDALGLAAGTAPMPQRYYEAERASIAAEIRARLATNGTSSELPRVDVLEGATARAVVEAARARGARVIVIGTGGHDVLGRRLFGENALEILSISDRPVLVVPPEARAGAVSVAVVAVDFSPSSVRAARAIIPMMSEHGRLHLVHVRTSHSLKAEMQGWGATSYEARCADLFRHFQRQLPALPSVTVDTTYLRGNAAELLINYATVTNAGLIACGRLAHSFTERLFVRSVSSELVRRAPCPVLVVPEQPGDVVTH